MRDKVELKNSEVSFRTLDDNGISYVPCTKERPLFGWGKHYRNKKHIGIDYWPMTDWHWEMMDGVQLFTGYPSNREGAYLTDVDIEKRLVDVYPDVCGSIIKDYQETAMSHSLIIQTKSGGYRLCGYYPYLDPKRSYSDEGGMLLEIFSIGSLSRLDNRYKITEGNFGFIPFMTKEFLQRTHNTISEYAVAQVSESRNEPIYLSEEVLNGVSIQWYKKGGYTVSELMPTEYCAATAHDSNRNEVQYTLFGKGMIRGYCHNCGEAWRVKR